MMSDDERFAWYGRCLPALLFLMMSALDLVLQVENRTQLQEIFANPFLDFCGTVLTALKVGMFWGGLVFLMGKWSRIFYLPLWLWVCVVEAVEVFARIFYRMSLDGDWLMLVLASSRQEMGEFLSGIGWSAIGLGILSITAVFVGGGVLLWKATGQRVTRRSILIGLGMMLPFLVWNLLVHSPVGAFNDMMYTFLPVDTVHNWKVYTDIGSMAAKPQVPYGLKSVAQEGNRPFGIFVIGESATRAHWHLYGYERPTTPMMDDLRSELVVFDDVTATHFTTGKALRMLLTEATVESPEMAQCSFPQELAEVGYHPVLLSAQSRWGRWEGVETLLFSGCGRKIYLDEHQQNEKLEEGPFDGDLLPILNDELASRESPDVVFLHLQGSHASPFYRYPVKKTVYPRYEGDAAPGVPEDDERMQSRVNCYDNSIAYTDHILSALILRLKERKGISFLVYLSDHGETPKSGTWRDQSSPDLLKIPFVVWFSPEYRRMYPDVVKAVVGMAKEPLRLDRAKTVLRMLSRISIGDQK